VPRARWRSGLQFIKFAGCEGKRERGAHNSSSRRIITVFFFLLLQRMVTWNSISIRRRRLRQCSQFRTRYVHGCKDWPQLIRICSPDAYSSFISVINVCPSRPTDRPFPLAPHARFGFTRVLEERARARDLRSVIGISRAVRSYAEPIRGDCMCSSFREHDSTSQSGHAYDAARV